MASEIESVLAHLWVHLIESSLFATGMVAVYFLFPFVRARHRFILLQAAMLKFVVPTSLIVGLLPRLESIGTPLDSLFVSAISGSAGMAPSASITPSGPFWIACVWMAGILALFGFAASAWIRKTYSKVGDKWTDEECSASHRELFKQAGCPLEWVDGPEFPSIGVRGVFRPKIVINRVFLEALSEEEVQLAFLHERAHIERYDNLWRGIHNLTVFVFWFHPLVWFLRSRLCLESEHACDEAVLSREESPSRYAECLVRAATLVSTGGGAWAASLTGTSLKKRVTRILTFNPMKESKLKAVALIAFSVALMGALVSASSTALAERVEFANLSNSKTIYKLSEVDTYPKAIYQIDPEYPEDLPDEGWATIEWVIDSEGRVIRPRVVDSSERGFGKPSIDAILQSEWHPATKDGEAVSVLVRQRMEFKRGGKRRALG